MKTPARPNVMQASQPSYLSRILNFFPRKNLNFFFEVRNFCSTLNRNFRMALFHFGFGLLFNTWITFGYHNYFFKWLILWGISKISYYCWIAFYTYWNTLQSWTTWIMEIVIENGWVYPPVYNDLKDSKHMFITWNQTTHDLYFGIICLIFDEVFWTFFTCEVHYELSKKFTINILSISFFYSLLLINKTFCWLFVYLQFQPISHLNRVQKCLNNPLDELHSEPMIWYYNGFEHIFIAQYYSMLDWPLFHQH